MTFHLGSAGAVSAAILVHELAIGLTLLGVAVHFTMAALLLWPLVWLIALPFRLLGIAVEGVFELMRAIIMLPARALRR